MATTLQLLEQEVEETYADLALHDGREHPETRPPPNNAVEAEDLKLNDTAFDEADCAYGKAIKAAIRGGSTSHPLVRAWLTTQQDFGQWDLLRETKRGLETGVRRPMKIADVLLEVELVELHTKGYSLEQIAQRLTTRGFRGMQHRTAVHDRLEMLGLA